MNRSWMLAFDPERDLEVALQCAGTCGLPIWLNTRSCVMQLEAADTLEARVAVMHAIGYAAWYDRHSVRVLEFHDQTIASVYQPSDMVGPVELGEWMRNQPK